MHLVHRERHFAEDLRDAVTDARAVAPRALLERSTLTVGAPINAGDLVGYSGDSQFTCLGSPHLHLEIRDHSRARLFNPIPLIDADWEAIALIGGNRTFQRNLDGQAAVVAFNGAMTSGFAVTSRDLPVVSYRSGEENFTKAKKKKG